ncbi:MAG: DUF3638 domain-containing protein [Chlamydiales bacterium]|nr:DUF3638 domain-containing protein [Chlamydiales bacterium]
MASGFGFFNRLKRGFEGLTGPGQHAQEQRARQRHAQQQEAALARRVLEFGKESFEARSQESGLLKLEEALRKLLGGEGAWPEINWRQFVLQMGGATSNYANYAGGDVRWSIEAVREVLSLWKENRGRFLSSRMSPIIAKELLERLNRVEELSRPFNLPGRRCLSNSEVRTQASLFLSGLRCQLAKYNFAYAFIGVRGGLGGSPGHAMCVRFESSGENVIVSILNLGDGVQDHPVLKKQTTHFERSYSSFPIIIAEKDLYVAEEAICRLIRLNTDEPTRGCDYSAHEVYDIFRLLGELQTEYSQSQVLLALPTQKNPNCSEMAVQLFLRDNLNRILSGLEEEATLRQIKLFFFEYRFCQLISAFRTPANKEQVEIFLDALQVFSFELLDIRQRIGKEEFIKLGKILHHMRGKVEQVESQAEENNSEPPQQRERIYWKEMPSVAVVAEVSDKQMAEEVSGVLRAPIHAAGTPLMQKVKDWMCYLSKLKAGESFLYFLQCVYTLPIPKFGEDDEWDLVEKREIPDFVALLRAFVSRGFEHQTFDNESTDLFQDYFMTIHILYAAVDKLVRRCSEYQLNTFASPFLMEHAGRNTFETLTSGHQQRRYAAIEAYFEGTRKERRPEIFPIASTLNIESEDQQLAGQGGVKNRTQGHACYVRRLMRKSQGSLVEIWEPLLPQPVRDLYFMVFISQVIAPRSGFFLEKLPRELVWEKGQDLNALDTLHMCPELSDRDRQTSSCTMWNRDVFNGSPGMHFRPRPSDYYCRTLEVNQAVTERVPEGGPCISDRLWCDLLRLSSSKELSMNLFLDWLPLNYRALAEKVVRSEIYFAWFAPGRLAHALEKSPELIDRFRQVIEGGLKEFSTGSFPAREFLVDCALGIEACMPRELRRFDYFADPILFLSTLSDARYLLRTSLMPTLDKEGCQLLVHILFSTENGVRMMERLQREHNREELLADSSSLVLEHIQRDEEMRALACNTVLEAFGLPPEESWQIEGTSCVGTRHTLDFYRRKIERMGLGFGRYLQLGEDFKQFAGDKAMAGMFFGSGNEMQSMDGEYVVRTAGGKRQIFRRFMLNGEQVEGVYTKIDSKKLRNTPLQNLIDVTTAYTLKDGRIALFIEGTLYYIVCFPPDGEVHINYCNYGNETSYQLINLSGLSQGNPLYSFASRLPFPHTVKCVARQDCNPGIYFIHFRDIQITFSAGLNNEKLFPGYRLVLDEVWDHYPDALVLESKYDKKVVIPNRMLTLSNPGFGAGVRPQERLNPGRKKYRVYDVDPLSGTLIASEAEDYLYLALLYKMRRNFTAAAHYLEKVRTTDNLMKAAEELIECFFKLSEQSNHSTAFDMKLLYLLVSNQLVMCKEQFEGRRHFPSSILNWAFATYDRYLGTMSADYQYCEIPRKLRLSLKQEETVLRFLYAQSELRNRKLPSLLVSRFLSLCMPGRTTTERIAPLAVPLLPRTFRDSLLQPHDLRNAWILMDKKPSPSGFNPSLLGCVRYPDGALFEHFPTLYQKAKECVSWAPTSFDFTLLSLLASREDPFTSQNPLASLLFYVRFFPQEFRSIAPHSMLTRVALIEALIERVEQLSHMQRWREKLGELLSQSKEFVALHSEEMLTVPVQLEEEEVSLPKPKMGEPSFSQAPFADICPTIYMRVDLPFEKGERNPFTEEATTPLESDILAVHKEGYEALKGVKFSNYSDIEGRPVEAVPRAVTELNRHHEALQKEAQELRQSILERLNQLPEALKGTDEEVEYHLCSDAQQWLPILPETVMKEVILKGNAAIFRAHRKYLTPEDIDAIIRDVKAYYYLLVKGELAKEAISAIEKGDAQKAGELLDYTFLCDPIAFPEVYYYKMVAGKLPRPDQVEVYKWVCTRFENGENALFQLAAGAGKTSYLRQLFFLRARMFGFMPVAVTPPAIYAVDKQNLDEMWASKGEAVALLELGIKHRLKKEDYKYILNELLRYHREGQVLLISPQAYYSLKLHAKNAALSEGDSGKLYFIDQILHFFETKCVLILDESHHNLDPVTRAIFGIRPFEKINRFAALTVLEFMKLLVGRDRVMRLDDGRKVADVASLCSKPVLQERIPSSEEIEAMKRALALALAGEEYIQFLTNKEEPPPSAFFNLQDKEKQQLAVLRHCLLSLLEEVVTLRTHFDHQPSPYREECIQTPARHKTPSTSQFKDPFLTLALTIKTLYQEGITPAGLKRLLQIYVEKDLRERRAGIECSSAQEVMTSVFENFTSLKGKKLRDLLLDDESSIQHLHHLLSNSRICIDLFIQEVIFEQVGSSPEQVTASPADFMLFSQLLLFSATPQHPATYPRGVTHFLPSAKFEAQVVTQYCKEQNNRFCSFVSLEALLQNHEHEVIIDPGGYIPMSNEALASAWLSKNMKLRGVLYFGKNGICLKVRERKDVEFKGSDSLSEQLRRHQLNLEKDAIGVYFDAEHTEAANILVKREVKAFMILPDELGSARLIQAIMRLRGFCSPHYNQTLTWVLAPGVQENLPEVSGRGIYHWSTANDIKKMRKRIVLAAFQEIALCIEGPFRERLAVARTGTNKIAIGDKLWQCYQKHAGGLIEMTQRNLVKLFATPDEEVDTAHVLFEYAQLLHKQLYQEPLTAKMQELINPIITRASGYVRTISSKLSLGGEIESQQEMVQQTQVVEVRPRPRNPIDIEHAYGSIGLDDEDFFEKVSGEMDARTFYQAPGFSPKVFLGQNHTRTAHFSDDPSSQLLKPIDVLLLVEKDGDEIAFVSANQIMEAYKKEMEKFEKSSSPHRVLMISALSGGVIAEGKGALRMKPKVKDELLRSQWVRDLRIDAGLVAGKILQMEHGIGRDAIVERLARFEGIHKVWARLMKLQIHRDDVYDLGMKQLLNEISQAKQYVE